MLFIFSGVSKWKQAAAAALQAVSMNAGPTPRNAINERLRGLRQLVRELRDKNESKKPKPWVVNYGNPVSRRLIRKPLAAASV